jgi:O-antigen/teichoic acid export membrane protein
MLGEEKLYQKIMFFALLINFLLNLLLIPIFKELSGALSTALSLFYGMLYLFLLQRKSWYKYFYYITFYD